PLALAFSGGLDTSFCVPRLSDQGWAVHTVYVNTGGSGPEERAAIAAQAGAHGSTGAGNDQVRFDVALRVLAPDLEIVTPIRDSGITRDQAIAYLTERKLPVPAKASAY